MECDDWLSILIVLIITIKIVALLLAVFFGLVYFAVIMYGLHLNKKQKAFLTTTTSIGDYDFFDYSMPIKRSYN